MLLEIQTLDCCERDKRYRNGMAISCDVVAMLAMVAMVASGIRGVFAERSELRIEEPNLYFQPRWRHKWIHFASSHNQKKDKNK